MSKKRFIKEFQYAIARKRWDPPSPSHILRKSINFEPNISREYTEARTQWHNTRNTWYHTKLPSSYMDGMVNRLFF